MFINRIYATYMRDYPQLYKGYIGGSYIFSIVPTTTTTTTTIAPSSKFVAGGVGTNSLSYSLDSNTWIPSLNGNDIFANPAQVYGSCYGNGTWVVTGDNGVIAYSSDGITWTASTNGNDLFSHVYSVCWNGSKFVAGGDEPPCTIAYSTDGIVWTASDNGAVIMDGIVNTLSSVPAPQLVPAIT